MEGNKYMKTIKNILLIGTFVLLVTGCGKQKIDQKMDHNLNDNYKKMNVGNNGINGYTLDLRIYGSYNNKKIYDIVRIQNYKNKTYEIAVSRNTSIESTKIQEEVYRIKKNKIYSIQGNKEIEFTGDINYKNPNVYLEGLNNIVKKDPPKIEKIDGKKYTVYSVTFQKNIINKLLKDTSLLDLSVDKNIDGKLYLDSEGYVYKIIYQIDDITIAANYFGINQARELS